MKCGRKDVTDGNIDFLQKILQIQTSRLYRLSGSKKYIYTFKQKKIQCLKEKIKKQ